MDNEDGHVQWLCADHFKETSGQHMIDDFKTFLNITFGDKAAWNQDEATLTFTKCDFPVGSLKSLGSQPDSLGIHFVAYVRVCSQTG